MGEIMVDVLLDSRESIGVFKGFKEGGMEFHADLAIPYSGNLNNVPMHGRFILIQLENEEEAILGRITSISSDGKLAYGAGEDYNLRAAKDKRPIPEDIKEDYLKYKVDIRILGGVKLKDKKIIFVPSFRRIPHVGSPIFFPSNDVLLELARSNSEGTPIGLLALGEYIFAGNNAREHGQDESWMQICDPEVLIKFDVNNLISRRSFVFARAGFGKSNLNKLLFSSLYRNTPTTPKRNGKKVPVGTIIFDRDGEYFWPDDKGRPGLCDVEWLKDNLVVFTSREAPSEYYGSFTASQIKLDIRQLSPSTVVTLSISPDRQDQQNIKKLKSMGIGNWSKLVDLIYRDRNNASAEEIGNLLHINDGKSPESNPEIVAARSNMTSIVSSLHSPASRLLEMLHQALRDGKLCIFDVSQVGGDQALIMCGIILKYIFKINQDEFTKSEPKSIPTIAVIEEAQSVLSAGNTTTEPFISWVKEGRKYDLGSLMVTQQPGSIPTDILSQGDNWFVFHLLSDKDLYDVKRANAHFSNDILSSLLNEPIVGQGVFWSSVNLKDEGMKPYPIPIRILPFEKMISRKDVNNDMKAIDTYASLMRKRFDVISESSEMNVDNSQSVIEEEVDFMRTTIREIAGILKIDLDLEQRMRDSERGIPWGYISGDKIKSLIPDTIPNPEDYAFRISHDVIVEMWGEENVGWKSSNHDTQKSPNVKFVKKLSDDS